MTITEARQIMGSDSDELTDDAMQALIDQLNSLARGFVDMVLNGDFYTQ